MNGPVIHRFDEIRAAADGLDLLPAMREAFRAYSSGRAVVPPVGELIFDEPPGDVHIKYGYVREDDTYLVKIASGFYRNASSGLPANPGLMILADRHTGQLRDILLEDGYLTNLRTAAAGAFAAHLCLPERVERIAVLGAGTQARLQLLMLRTVTDCRTASVWARRRDAAEVFVDDMAAHDFAVSAFSDVGEATRDADLIVTATPAARPLLMADMVKPSAHVTAIGADTTEKNEVDPMLIGRAGLVVVDSVAQASERGELRAALAAGTITADGAIEIGRIVDSPVARPAAQPTIAILTGIATQDIAIAQAVVARLRECS